MDVSCERWRQVYADKVKSAKDAIALIRPGRRILIGSGAAEPVSLVNALVEHGTQLADNEIVHLLTLGPAPYVAPELQDRMRHCAFFIGANVRSAVREGRADFMPVFLSEVPELIRSRRVRVDVALIQVSPPDRHGMVSLGVSVDIVRSAVESAALVIAEVNPRMPRTAGDSFLHVRQLDALVPVDRPLLEQLPEPLDDVAKAIGQHVARLVPNGATLQVGIGTLPNAVLAALKDHHELGVHSEMISDGIMDLANAGVITGVRKKMLAGKIVTSFVMGSQRLYEWVNEHPAVELRPSEFTNDPFVIARNEKMISINGALSVDLTGQVAADSMGEGFFSGIGGQVDFIRGAARSPGGKSIIAMRSTAKKGTVSRIQVNLPEGTGVVTSRGDVRYVVTEYGIADLWGKSVRERATALICIAHPDFREQLAAQARAKGYLLPKQRVPRAIAPWTEEQVLELPEGVRIRVRPARLSDAAGIQALLYQLSEESRRQRFHAAVRTHHLEDVEKLVDLDYDASMGLVVTEEFGDSVIAFGRYDVDPATRLAELGLLVRDDWQSRGVGTALMHRLQAVAAARGLAGFTAEVLSGNVRMLALLHKSELEVTSTTEDGVFHLEARFPSWPLSKPGSEASATPAH